AGTVVVGAAVVAGGAVVAAESSSSPPHAANARPATTTRETRHNFMPRTVSAGLAERSGVAEFVQHLVAVEHSWPCLEHFAGGGEQNGGRLQNDSEGRPCAAGLIPIHRERIRARRGHQTTPLLPALLPAPPAPFDL